MKTILLSLCLMAFMAPSPLLASSPGDAHHVMWTNPKGKEKCCNKKSKEKADQCAKKMQAKGKATKVKVMTGKCKNM